MKEHAISILRWSERYTKTDMVYLASGGFWLTAEQILIGLAAFGVSIAFAHFVPKDIYGTYRFLLSLFWTLTAFSLTGISTALTRAIAKGEEGAYRQAIPFSLLGGLPMSFIAGSISLYYFLAGNTVLGYGALAICILGPLLQTGYLFSAILEGKRDFKRTAIFGIALSFVPALLLLALMPFAKTPLPFFLAYLGGNVLIAGILSLIAFRIYRPSRVKSDEFKNLGWHLSAINILGTIASQFDQLLVFHYLGAAELAIYSIATALPDQLKSMATKLVNLSFPKFVKRPIGEIRQMLWHRISVVTVVFLLGIIAYIFLTPLFFHIFFPTYEDSIFYSQLYALSLISIGGMIPDTVLQAHAAKQELYIFSIVSAIVQITALFFGIFWYGLIGLIAARALSRLFGLLFSALLVTQYAKRMQH
jgi:O-antigen/teichoic acid export membrane protein